MAVCKKKIVGEMEQKQAIWCLKHKYLNINLLFIDLLYKINITSRFKVLLFVTYSIIQDIISSEMYSYICNHAYFEEKMAPFVRFLTK